MNRRLKIVLGTTAATVIAGVAAAGVATAADSGTDDGPDGSDVAITGEALETASAAALAVTGGGEVVDSEVEESGYEVEVNLPDGSQTEVQLDANLKVVSSDVNEEGDDGDAD
jgi:uncharacterized membrane protein YkoI